MKSEKAIIISTHLLEEVEAVCSRAIIIARGRVLADGTPTELAARSRTHNAVRLGAALESQGALREALALLPVVAAVEEVHDAEGTGLLVFPRGDQPIIGDVAATVRAHGVAATELRVERGRLDDVFRDITAPAPPLPQIEHLAA